MKKHHLWLFGLILLDISLAEDKYAAIQPFFNQYCTQCHGAEEQKAEVRLDDMNSIDAELWNKIYDQVDFGDMPPEDAKQPDQPTLTKLTELIHAASADDNLTISTGLRRLNRREYANTVKDLLGLDGIYDPSGKVFGDEIDEGFDTNAKSLVISNELLLEYLDSAKTSLRQALYVPSMVKPETKVKRYHTGRLQGGERRFTNHTPQTTITRAGNQAISGDKDHKVAVAGRYRVRVQAKAVDKKFYKNLDLAPGNRPIKMGIGVALDGPGGSKKIHQSFDLVYDRLKLYEAELSLDKGGYPYVAFLNGISKPASAIRQAFRHKTLTRKELSNMDQYRGPGIEITKFEIEGPLEPEWPPATYKTTFQIDHMPDFQDATVREQVLQNFMHRAWRKPVRAEDIKQFLDYLNQQYAKTNNWHESFIHTLAAVMASHDFLYIHEEVGTLPAYQLINRLSYFLWSSMPDDELFRLAETGEILKPNVYQKQVQRMIADPKINAFINGFTTQWLSLDILGTMPPDIKDKRYKDYHKKNYETVFRNETLNFFRHIFNTDQPVGDFLDSDYTFINGTLAELYAIPLPNSDTNSFQKVSLPVGSMRGGLMGQASIHALTSNGVETLPVTRGHWVLDELMGTPPPPPPKEVPALVPDLNGLDTVRKQLVRHREDKSCFECHKLMDPAGLALESFDIIGRYRKRDDGGNRIDASGEYLGQPFKDVRGLRKILRSNEKQFAINLLEKIAEYAKGRKLNGKDLIIVEQLVEESSQSNYRFKTLFEAFMLSDLMLNR